MMGKWAVSGILGGTRTAEPRTYKKSHENPPNNSNTPVRQTHLKMSFRYAYPASHLSETFILSDFQSNVPSRTLADVLSLYCILK